MQIAERLNLDYDDVLGWSGDKFQNWVAYFRIVDRKRNKSPGAGGS